MPGMNPGVHGVKPDLWRSGMSRRCKRHQADPPWIWRQNEVAKFDVTHQCNTCKRTANIRELKHSTSTFLGWVVDGETVEITRRNQVVGVVVPPAS